MAGKRCAVFGCYNYEIEKNSRSFFRFPKDKKLCDSWVFRCRRSDLNAVYEKEGPLKMYKTYRVCSDHFIENDFRNPKLFSQGMKPDILPTRNLPGSSRALEPQIKARLYKMKREDSVGGGSSNLPEIFQSYGMESMAEVVIKGEPFWATESIEIKSEENTYQLQDEIKEEIDEHDSWMTASGSFQLQIKSEMEEDNMNSPDKTQLM